MHSVKKPIKKRINNSSMGVKLSKRILLYTKVEPQIIMHTKAKICPIIVLFFMPNNYNKKVKGSVKNEEIRSCCHYCRCVITYWMWMHVLIWKDVCSFIVYCWSCFDCTFSRLSLCHKL